MVSVCYFSASYPKFNVNFFLHEGMTEKQLERIKLKIKKIKAALAAEKKRWGCYDDSRGLRYDPPQLYIKMGDFSGGLRYLNWFSKNFPYDIGYPNFLFEWTVILFKTGRRKEAEKKAFQTFCSNTYLFAKFFNQEIIPLDKWEHSNLEGVEFVVNSFDYVHTQTNLADFSVWLNGLLNSEKFIQYSHRYLENRKQLSHEKDSEVRMVLIKEKNELEGGYGGES